MNVWITTALLLFSAGGFAVSLRRHVAPADPLNPRMIPWMFVALTFGALFLLLLSHLFGLAGLETGGGFVRNPAQLEQRLNSPGS